MGRLRTNTDAPDLIKQYPNYCDLESFKLPKTPIYLEIGCGKGDFLIENAINHPNIFFFGVEKYSTVILKALKKIKNKDLRLANLCFSCGDIKDMNFNKFNKVFSKIFLNFSDPWPKKRHEKRRLTSLTFLNIYRKILTSDGTIEFKTDNDCLYVYTLDILKQQKDTQILYFTKDMYKELNNKLNINNIQTEYERKFLANGKTIKKIVWKFDH